MATKTVTAQGSAQLDTAQKKFGSASGLFASAGDYCTIPNDADFNFGSGAFTVDFWIKTSTTNAPADEFDLFVIDKNNSHTAGNFGFQVAINSDKTIGTSFSNGTNIYYAQSNTNTCDTNWHHIAVVRNSNTLTIYVDGVPGATTDTISGSQNFDVNMVVEIANRFGAGEQYLGWIDELRVSKGTARWTSDFSGSLPAAEYSTDASTVLLLHMNGTDASTTFTDDSVASGIAYSMDCGTGSFTLTGKDITVQKSLNAHVSTGQFTLTGIDILVSKAMNLIVGTGQFILTGYDIITALKGWAFGTKNTSNWINQNKNTSTWTEQNKNNTTWTPQDKS